MDGEAELAVGQALIGYVTNNQTLGNGLPNSVTARLLYTADVEACHSLTLTVGTNLIVLATVVEGLTVVSIRKGQRGDVRDVITQTALLLLADDLTDSVWRLTTDEGLLHHKVCQTILGLVDRNGSIVVLLVRQ